MPKRLKKLPIPPKPKRSIDPNVAAHAMLNEHLARMGGDQPASEPASFAAQLSAHMAKLGAKGGKVSGAKRMEMPVEQRKAIALLAARARWKKRPKA